MAESYDTTSSGFKPKSIPKSEASKKTIRSALQGSAGFLFSSLSADELEQVVMAMEEKRLKKGEKIISQGDKGDNFYGKLETQKHLVIISTYNPPFNLRSGRRGYL